ncbi:MAG: hypothetical protein AAF907_12690 [Planctomycetota bacterium]
MLPFRHRFASVCLILAAACFTLPIAGCSEGTSENTVLDGSNPDPVETAAPPAPGED